MDAVRTQLPYAAVVGRVAMAVGDSPPAYGLPPWVSLAAGAAVLFLIVRFVGRPVEDVAGPVPERSPADAVA